MGDFVGSPAPLIRIRLRLATLAIVLACPPLGAHGEEPDTAVGWVALGGLPVECRIQRAVPPESLIAPSWVPCIGLAGGAVEGCRTSAGEQQTSIVGGWRDGRRSWLRLLGGSLERGRVLALAVLDGPVRLALREPAQQARDSRSCRVTALTAGAGRLAFAVQLVDRSAPSRSRAWLFVGSADAVNRFEEPAFQFSPSFVKQQQTIVGLWISRQLVALRTSPDGSLYRLRDSTLELLTGELPGLPQHVSLVGDHLMWESWQGVNHVRLAHARGSQPARIWRDRREGDTKSFGTDGVDLAWMQGRERGPDGAYRELDLYTAGYRRDLARVEARRLRRMSTRNSAVVGGGWYALRRSGEDGSPRVEVYSLRDGTRRTFAIPGGLVVDDPYFASRREIVYPGRSTVRFAPSLLPVDPEP